MSESRIPDVGLDDETRRGLKEHLEPPGGALYWDRLSERILARLAQAAVEPEWWTVLGGWARVGIAAAIVMMFLAGAALATVIMPDPAAAYQEVVVNPPAAMPITPAVVSTPDAAREETFRVILTY